MTSPFDTKQFHRELDRCGATSTGAKWVTEAVDPFHDSQLEIVGMPDDTAGRSIVYDVRKQINIVKPTAFAAGKWDAHIAFVPLVRNSECNAANLTHFSPAPSGNPIDTSYDNDLDEVATQVPFPQGVVMCCAVPSGGDTFPAAAATTAANLEYSSIDVSEFFSESGATRIIGGAFEVHNVTEDLNKSGSVTCYRFENETNLTAMRIGNTGQVQGNRMVHRKRLPPRTLAQAKLLDGITFDAAEGALVPLIMSADDNHPSRGIMGPFILSTDDHHAYCQVGDGAIASAEGLNLSYDLHFMSSGAYFSGLSDETSLELSIRFLVEQFPLPASDLQALAHPSPSVDWRAMQCLSEIQATQLAGYPVNMNAKGDFFRNALNAIRSVARSAAPMVAQMPTPRAQLASAVLTEIGGKPKGKKKKDKPKPDVSAGAKRIS